jgi:hypothetical protein
MKEETWQLGQELIGQLLRGKTRSSEVALRVAQNYLSNTILHVEERSPAVRR